MNQGDAVKVIVVLFYFVFRFKSLKEGSQCYQNSAVHLRLRDSQAQKLVCITLVHTMARKAF